MTEHEIRVEMRRILDAHDEALTEARAIHAADASIRNGAAIDRTLSQAIDANRAALRLLDQMDEGVQS